MFCGLTIAGKQVNLLRHPLQPCTQIYQSESHEGHGPVVDAC